MGQPEPQNSESVAEFIALHSPGERLTTICQWTERCYEAGKMVAIRVADSRTADRLDELLWTFNDMTFLPHGVARNVRTPILEPILIYSGDDDVAPADVLFEAASGQELANFTEFQYIFDFAEIYDDELRQIGRKRYSAYQEAGYKMRYVDR